MTPTTRRVALALLLAAFAGVAPAALDIAGLDRSVDPCVDFYQFANRKWLESTAIPDDRPRWGVTDAILQRNEELLIAALEAARAGPLPAPGSAQRMAIDYYASGMDREAIARAGLRPLDEGLGRIARVRDAASLAGALAWLQRRGVDAGFAFNVRPDAKDSTRYLAEIAQAGLGLPDRD